MVKILLAENQALVRPGLKFMIEIDEDLKITGEASNGVEAIALCEKQFFDLALLDIRMPEMNSLEVARIIRERWPEMTVLILTTFNDEKYALEALKYQVNGYLLKGGEAEELIRSIKSALAGGLVIEDQVAEKVMPALMASKKDVLEADETLNQRESSTHIPVWVDLDKLS